MVSEVADSRRLGLNNGGLSGLAIGEVAGGRRLGLGSSGVFGLEDGGVVGSHRLYVYGVSDTF